LTGADVPVHVDDEYVERSIVFAEAADDLEDLLIAVCPIARPPCAEGEAGRQRNAAGHTDVVAEGFAVVVGVTEEIPVLTLARGTLHHPRPGTLLAFQKSEIGGVKERAV